MTCPPGGSEGSGGNEATPRRVGYVFTQGAPKRVPGVPSNTWRIRGEGMGEGGYETRSKAADTTDRVYTTRRLQWRKWEEEGREDKKGKETHENKLSTAKLFACIHGMQKGDGGEGGNKGGW